MVKLLIAILVTVLLIAFGVYSFGSDKSSDKPGSGTTQFTNPSDAINDAKDAVGQTQDLQDKLNSKAQDQLDQ